MLKIFWVLAFLSTAAFAAGFSPVPVTGYNFGGIVPNTAVPPYSSYAGSLDLSNDALFQIGLPATTAGGLPSGGVLSLTVNSTTYGFSLGPYGGLNLLRVNPTGTLTLASPGKFPTLAVLGFSTQNNAPGAIEMVGDATLHFSDGSSSVYSRAIDLSDWYATSPQSPNIVTSAIGGIVNLTSGNAASAFEATADGPQFYISIITLTPGDAAKTLTSVGFGNFPFGGNTFQFIMALSAGNSTIPPQSTVPALSGWPLALLAVLLIGAAAAALRPIARA